MPKNIISILAFVLIFTPAAYAGRSDAGGADISNLSIGDAFMEVGMSIAGRAMNNAMHNNPDPFGNALDSFSSSLASNEIGRAASMFGGDGVSSYLLSNVASGAVSGYLNAPMLKNDPLTMIDPENMMSNAGQGAMTSLLSSAVTVAIDGDRINSGKGPGIFSSVLGSAVGTMADSRIPDSQKGSTIAGAALFAAASSAIDDPKINAFLSPVLHGAFGGAGKDLSNVQNQQVTGRWQQIAGPPPELTQESNSKLTFDPSTNNFVNGLNTSAYNFDTTAFNSGNNFTLSTTTPESAFGLSSSDTASLNLNRQN